MGNTNDFEHITVPFLYLNCYAMIKFATKLRNEISLKTSHTKLIKSIKISVSV